MLFGCAHVNSNNGVEFHFERLNQLHSGMTIPEVQSLLGKPLSIEKSAQETIYHYAFGNVSGIKMILLNSSNTYQNAIAKVVFDGQTVKTFEYEITEPKK